MSNITFRLKNGAKTNEPTKPEPIYIRYSLGRKLEFSASIGFKVAPKDWNDEKFEIRNRAYITYKVEANNLIKSLSKHFADFDSANKAKGYTPTRKEVKNYFENYFSKGADIIINDFFGFIDSFLEDAKTKPHAKTGKPLSKNTIKTYVDTALFLRKFNESTNYKLSFENINMDFYTDFVKWCNDLNHSKNSTGKHIKTIKVFMNEANEQGVTDNQAHKSKNFIVLKEEVNHIYLTLNELQAIYELDISHSEPMDRARDLFLIGSFTGLRVSDFNKLSERNFKDINGTNILEVKTQKTGSVVNVPLHPIVTAIFKKYGGTAPKKLPEQKINDLIKKIGEKAKITKDEYKTITKGGKEVTTKQKRYKLIHNHTARRSFCTNAYLSGMGTLDIMAISGHKTEKAFLKYIKVTAEQTALKMAEHPFFKESTALKVAR